MARQREGRSSSQHHPCKRHKAEDDDRRHAQGDAYAFGCCQGVLLLVCERILKHCYIPLPSSCSVILQPIIQIIINSNKTGQAGVSITNGIIITVSSLLRLPNKRRSTKHEDAQIKDIDM